MRVQLVWAKTGTSPVAFHNTTVDVALCPAREGRRGVGLPPRSKANNPVISNGPGRLWRRLIPLTPWRTVLRGRSATAGRSDPTVAPASNAISLIGTTTDTRARAPAVESRVLAAPEWLVTSAAARAAPDVAALAVSSGPTGAWPTWAGANDRVQNGCAFSGRRRQRVPFGALYDLNGTQWPLCPPCLLRVVTMRTVFPRPGVVGRLLDGTAALGTRAWGGSLGGSPSAAGNPASPPGLTPSHCWPLAGSWSPGSSGVPDPGGSGN